MIDGLKPEHYRLALSVAKLYTVRLKKVVTVREAARACRRVGWRRVSEGIARVPPCWRHEHHT